MDAVVTIRNLSVTFDEGFKALSNVNVELPAGKIIGVIGPSGAGKTTLIRAIVGRQKLAGGNIEVLGKPASSPALRGERSYMTQEPAVYADLTVRQNLRYFATVFGIKRKQLNRTLDSLLRTVDLSKQDKQLVANLSGGQKQRVSLAVALIGSPRLLVLDEPTVGLDPLLRQQLWDLFRHLAEQEKTLIISSHVMDEADRCDELLLIRGGQVLAQGSPRSLCRQTGSESVEESFIKLVGNRHEP